MQIKANKPQINLVSLGNVDSGKSTTLGHFIYKLGGIDERTLKKYEKEATEKGMGSFKYAWLLDRLKAERERGITIDISYWNLETNHFQYTLIDTPGLRDFIKNTIAGINQSDIALLIISAPRIEFDVGQSKNGQVQSLCTLAKALGVKQLIICINKMDEETVNYRQSRYDEIVAQVSDMLQSIGLHSQKEIHYIPISGFTGENLLERSQNFPWYNGPTLFEALDLVMLPHRPVEMPLRLPLIDVYKIAGIGTVPVGRVECGILRQGMQIQFTPGGITTEVISIEKNYQHLEQAFPGEIVGFHVKGISIRDLRRGQVCSDVRNFPSSQAISFTALVIIMSHPGVIHQGYTPVIDCHTCHIACRFDQLLSKVDQNTEKVIEDSPKDLKQGEAGLVRMVPLKPMSVEIFSEFPPLGRFVIRDMRLTIGIGIVKSVERKQ